MNIRFLGFQDIKRVCDIMRLTLWSLGCTSNTETPKNSLSHICNKILHDIESDRILKRLKVVKFISSQPNWFKEHNLRAVLCVPLLLGTSY